MTSQQLSSSLSRLAFLVLTSALASSASAAPSYFQCRYNMLGTDGSRSDAGCSKGAFEAKNAKAALDRCMGKTPEKDGLVDGADCCTFARKENQELAAKKPKITVSISIYGSAEAGPEAACR